MVSGFCLIVGLEVAVKKKLRCFHMSWGNGERDAPDHILIRLQEWAPHPVPQQRDGLMKHLGVRHERGQRHTEEDGRRAAYGSVK